MYLAQYELARHHYQCCHSGPLTTQQTDMFMRNQRFAGLKFPDMHRPETLERRFAGHLDPEAMSFLT